LTEHDILFALKMIFQNYILFESKICCWLSISLYQVKNIGIKSFHQKVSLMKRNSTDTRCRSSENTGRNCFS